MRHCIFILGMHRSGTSALSGMLNILGVYQGRHLIPPSSANPKGYFENQNILHFNEKILSGLGSSWDDMFFNDKNLNVDKYTEALKTLITEEFGHVNRFSIKDPRICLLFPIYEKALTELDIRICPMIIYRNPVETAISLQKRDGFSLEKGLILWMEHFLLSENYTRPYPRLFIPFDQMLKDHRALIDTIQDTWRLDLETDTNKQKALQTFLQLDLKHINLSSDSFSQKLPDFLKQLVQILSFPQGIDDLNDTLDEIKKVYFREKNFFCVKELRDSLKEVNPYRYAQFYLNTGQGFYENQSRRFPNPEDKEILEFNLSSFPCLRGIRFDPLNQAIAISIVSVSFQLENEEWLQAKAIPLNACFFLDEIDYFSHDDPQYFIPVPLALDCRLRRLMVQVRYHKIGGREVAPIVCAMLRQLLQKQRNALVHHIIKRERWWKKKLETETDQSQTMLREAELMIWKLEQAVDIERQAKTETDQKASKLEQSLIRQQAMNSQLIVENQHITQELKNFHNSKTWRLTRPIRNFISWWI